MFLFIILFFDYFSCYPYLFSSYFLKYSCRRQTRKVEELRRRRRRNPWYCQILRFSLTFPFPFTFSIPFIFVVIFLKLIFSQKDDKVERREVVVKLPIQAFLPRFLSLIFNCYYCYHYCCCTNWLLFTDETIACLCFQLKKALIVDWENVTKNKQVRSHSSQFPTPIEFRSFFSFRRRACSSWSCPPLSLFDRSLLSSCNCSSRFNRCYLNLLICSATKSLFI